MDSSKEFNLGRGIGFVQAEVEVDAKLEYRDSTREVGGKKVGLGPIGLPEGRWYGVK